LNGARMKKIGLGGENIVFGEVGNMWVYVSVK